MPRLEIGNSSENPWSRPSTTAWAYEISEATITQCCFFAGLEPGEDEERQTDEERGDAVLDVVVAGAGLVPGKHEGSERAGSAEVDDADDDEREPGEHGDSDDEGRAGVHGAAFRSWTRPARPTQKYGEARRRPLLGCQLR